MSMLAQKIETTTPAKPQASAVESPTRRKHLSAAVWSVLASSAGKETVRDDLIDGETSVVNLTVSGEIDGHEIDPVFIAAVMSVGHETERATSQTPEPSKLIAYLLGKMNETTRAAILRDLPGEFDAAGGNYPAVPDAVSEASEIMLKKIRACKRSKVRGAVSVKHQTKSGGALSDGHGLAIVG